MSGISQTRQNRLEMHMNGLVALVECPVLNLKSSWVHSLSRREIGSCYRQALKCSAHCLFRGQSWTVCRAGCGLAWFSGCCPWRISLKV